MYLCRYFERILNYYHVSKVNTVLMAASLCVAVTSCGVKENTSSGQGETVHNVFVVHPVAQGTGQARSFSGVVEENRTISLGFKTGGQIETINVKEGDRVSKGQLLATLDTKDYELVVKQLQVQYDQQKADHERLAYLHDRANVSESEFEKSASGLEQLGVQLQLNKNKLEYTRLYSPVSGVITAVNFEKAEMVDAGRPVFDIMDNGQLEIVVDLPVRDFMNRDQFNAIELAGKDGVSYRLNILSITPKADNNQLYQMKLSVPAEAATGLTAGMNVTVRVSVGPEGGEPVGECTIPLRSVFERDGNSCVWILGADSTVAARKVNVISVLKGEALVDGLEPGDEVVRAGVNSLHEGEKVNVITRTPESVL